MRTSLEGPFGEVLRATGPMARVNPLRFSTKYQDEETDLLYYGYRYYNSSTGRWISRDPINERGGKNLHGALGNNPVQFVDPLGLTWSISRFGARQAAASCDCGDTWDDLAQRIHMDSSDYTVWAHTQDAAPVPGKVYLIPNTVYFDVGLRKFKDFGPLASVSVLEAIAYGMASKYRTEGYYVAMGGGGWSGITAGEIIEHLQSEDIYIYGYFGHGGDGYINTAGFWGPGDEAVMPGRYTHYGISKMLLLGCETMMEFDHTSTEGAGWTYVHTPWEANVAKRGVVVGFEREITFLDLTGGVEDPESLVTVYPGTNNTR